MSVGRGGSPEGHLPEDGFNDLEQYSRSSDYIVRDSALSGGQQTFNPPNPPDIEPAGGLHRGEVAELVMVIIEDCAAYVKQQTFQGTTPSTILFENELKTKAPMHSSSIDADSSSPDVDLRGHDYDDDNLIARWYAHGYTPFNDTVNGSGGGGTIDAIEMKVYNYRKMFGLGPVLREDDVLFERASFTVNDADTEDIAGSNYIRTFWNVGEEGDFGVYD